jgi:hypothetical protein
MYFERKMSARVIKITMHYFLVAALARKEK